MTLLHPIWLLLALPLLAVLWVWPLPSRILRGLRLASLLLVLLAMSGLALKLPSRAGTVVVVADRSLSMPAGSEASQKEAIDLIQSAMGAEDRLAVVSFGQGAAVEQPPQGGRFAGFINEVGRDASNLSEAIERALSLVPQDGPGRVLLLSDGRWTGRDPTGAAARAAARGVALDYRSLQRPATNDTAVSHIDAPAAVTPGESFIVTVWVRSPIQQEVSYELLRSDRRLAAGKKTVPSGLSRLTFRDTAGEGGVQSYALRIAGGGEDAVPENNSARLLVGVRGPRPILCVSPSQESGLARLLASGGLNVKTLTPEAARWSLEDLAQYSAVVLENVPADKVGTAGMENLAAWVKETGAGLMMTGGKGAYGPGGYFKSPLEPIMPVSMELRREHRKLALAIVVTMDRSGSMAAPVGGGRTKMDLANLAAVQVLDLLSPTDEFGVIAVDSAPHTIAELGPAQNTAQTRGKILRVASEGGGIFIYEALTASAHMLVNASAGTRHIILFADAADSEEPGKYQELLEQCRRANITVSVIGLGRPSDQDAALLRDIASRGGGRIFFTENAEELPRLFAQDTFVVARSTFLEEPTPVKFTAGLVALTGKQFGPPAALGGYNLCYIRPNANLAGVTVDEYQAPVVAAWQSGSGRVLCYTGEADGSFTGPVAQWGEVGDFFTSMARWAAGDSDRLPGNMLVTQEVRNGAVVVQLHLDPEREVDGFTAAPKVTTLRGVAGSKPGTETAAMRWTTADTLELEVPLRGNETALATVDIAGSGAHSLPPVSLPYSPEFKPAEGDEGLLALERLARATAGRERISPAGIWQDLPRQPRLVDLRPWLLFVAITLFLLEVLERRTGLLSLRQLNVLQRARALPRPEKMIPAKQSQLSVGVPLRQPAGSRQPAEGESGGAPPESAAQPSAPEGQPGIVDALRQARQRAKGRTKRDER